MATFDAILSPAGGKVTKIAALAATTSSTEQAIGANQIFTVVATDDCHLKFGVAGMAAAANTDAYIAQKSKEMYDMGREFTHIRIYNPTVAAIDVYIQFFSKY